MLRLSWRFVVAWCAFSVAACGDGTGVPAAAGGLAGVSSTGPSGGAGTPGPSAGGSSGAASAGGGGASAGVGQAGGSASGGAMACSGYVDQSGLKLSVQLKNSSSVTLYLGPTDSTCEIEKLFQVEDGAHNLLTSVDGCHTSCQALMQTGPTACPLACAAPSTTTLAPGKTIEVPWDGRFGAPQTLPVECMATASGTATSCIQAQTIGPSAFTFKARAGTRRQCLDTSGTCGCTVDASGSCTSQSSVISGTIITTELLIKLEPRETSPGGQPPYIGLEFKDVPK